MHPEAREGVDFQVHDDVVVFQNKSAFRIIQVNLDWDLRSYFEFLYQGGQISIGDRALLEKLKRKIRNRAKNLDRQDLNRIFELVRAELRGAPPRLVLLGEYFSIFGTLDRPFGEFQPEEVLSVLRRCLLGGDKDLRNEALRVAQIFPHFDERLIQALLELANADLMAGDYGLNTLLNGALRSQLSQLAEIALGEMGARDERSIRVYEAALARTQTTSAENVARIIARLKIDTPRIREQLARNMATAQGTGIRAATSLAIGELGLNDDATIRILLKALQIPGDMPAFLFGNASNEDRMQILDTLVKLQARQSWVLEGLSRFIRESQNLDDRILKAKAESALRILSM